LRVAQLTNLESIFNRTQQQVPNKQKNKYRHNKRQIPKRRIYISKQTKQLFNNYLLKSESEREREVHMYGQPQQPLPYGQPQQQQLPPFGQALDGMVGGGLPTPPVTGYVPPQPQPGYAYASQQPVAGYPSPYGQAAYGQQPRPSDKRRLMELIHNKQAMDTLNNRGMVRCNSSRLSR